MLRPVGPCDIYEANGAPCAAAHSSTRALYGSYDGPLYQIMRQSDGKTLDINVVKATANDPGGYADAAAQDEFCKDTYCWVTILYDQSPYKNHLYQAPRGTFSGSAMGGYNNVPLADWAKLSGSPVPTCTFRSQIIFLAETIRISSSLLPMHVPM